MPNNPGVVSSVCTKWSKGTGGPSGSEHFNLVAQPTAYRWQNNRDGLQQDEAVAALRASAGESGFHEMNHPVIAQPVPFTESKRAQSVTDDETWVDGQVNPTLSLFDQGDTRATTVAVAFKPGQSAAARTLGAQEGVACTLEAGGGGNNKQAVAYGTDCYNATITGDVAATMGTPGSSVNVSGPTVMQAMTVRRPTLSLFDQGDTLATTVAVGFNWQNGGGYGKANEGLGITVEGTGPLQRCNTPAVAQAMTVRRLTPRECERLQGFPDDYTAIPWRKKPSEDCPDGPRYKALGNSMAVNCMEWIGERIARLS
jgi:hypothetical protein